MARTLTVPCVAWLLGVDRDTIKRQLDSGKMSGIKIGSRWQIDVDDLYMYVLNNSNYKKDVTWDGKTGVPESFGSQEAELFAERWGRRIRSAEEDFAKDKKKAAGK